MGKGSVVFACVMPHGAELIPELAEANTRAAELAARQAPGASATVAAAVPGAAAAVSREALAGFARLTQAIEEVGRRARAADPETIIIASPHSLRLEDGFTAVVTSESMRGELAVEAPVTSPASTHSAAAAPGAPTRPQQLAVVRAGFPCDRPLARRIVAGARQAGIQVVGVNFGSLSGPASSVEMDWGTLIPLYFLGRRSPAAADGTSAAERTSGSEGTSGSERTSGSEGTSVGEGASGGRAPSGPGPVEVAVGPWTDEPSPRPAIVVIGPSRDVPRSDLVRLGEIVADAAAREGRRVAFVASADQGHAHQAEGPYGYDPASAVYDRLISDIFAGGDPAGLEKLLDIDPALVEAGKPDSLWQMLILLGVLKATQKQGTKWSGEFLGYEVPTYFGMLAASYQMGK